MVTAILKRDVSTLKALCTLQCYKENFSFMEMLADEVEELRPLPVYSWSDLDKLPDQDLPHEVCRFLNQAEYLRKDLVKALSRGRISSLGMIGEAPAINFTAVLRLKFPDRYSPEFVSRSGGWGPNGIDPYFRGRIFRTRVHILLVQDPSGDTPDWEVNATTLGRVAVRFWRWHVFESLRRSARSRLDHRDSLNRLQFMGDEFIDERTEAEGVMKHIFEQEQDAAEMESHSIPTNILDLQQRLERLRTLTHDKETI